MSNTEKNAALFPEPIAAPVKILVVDDSVASAKTMGWAIEFMGYEVSLAHDGAGALATALDIRPDAILMDLSLPGLDGYELCRIMQKEHGFENTLFIAQTGWSEPEHRRRSKEAGFAHHLVKPVDMVRLEELLKKHFETVKKSPE